MRTRRSGRPWSPPAARWSPAVTGDGPVHSCESSCDGAESLLGNREVRLPAGVAVAVVVVVALFLQHEAIAAGSQAHLVVIDAVEGFRLWHHVRELAAYRHDGFIT